MGFVLQRGHYKGGVEDKKRPPVRGGLKEKEGDCRICTHAERQMRFCVEKRETNRQEACASTIHELGLLDKWKWEIFGDVGPFCF
jgi:hypothetical protein